MQRHMQKQKMLGVRVVKTSAVSTELAYLVDDSVSHASATPQQLSTWNTRKRVSAPQTHPHAYQGHPASTQ